MVLQRGGGRKLRRRRGGVFFTWTKVAQGLESVCRLGRAVLRDEEHGPQSHSKSSINPSWRHGPEEEPSKAEY